MVVQNISLNGKETDLTFTIKADDLKKTEKFIKQNKKISYKKLSFDKDVSKVSIIGGRNDNDPWNNLSNVSSFSFKKNKYLSNLYF
jgi:aspartokinase